MYYQFFPEELIALRHEVQFHPDLLTILAGQASDEFYIHLAEIAAYCNVILDGDYTRDDIIEICGNLVKELQKKRTIMVLPN